MRLFEVAEPGDDPFEGDLPAVDAYFQARSSQTGADFDALALEWVEAAGGSIERRGGEVEGIPVDAVVSGPNGNRFLIAAHGSFDEGSQAGLRRVDTLHKVGHRAVLLKRRGALPLIVVTSHLPQPGTKAALYLSLSADDLFDVLTPTGDFQGFLRLRSYLTDEPAPAAPGPAAWRVLPDQDELPFGGGDA